MSTMISEVYDAFLAAGVPEDKARRAAEALYDQGITAVRTDIATLKADVRLLKWQGGATLAFVLAMFWKLFAA
jgi:hypothetical protein